jgi:Domain of unknown function (DUF5658)
MDITATLFTVAITVGSVAPGQEPVSPAEVSFVGTLAAATPFVDERAVDRPSLRRLQIVPPSAARPSALIPLYASLAVLQGFDIYTTSASLKGGAVEANPVMKPVAGKNVASLVVKAAATAGSIYFTERAWKQNRKGAVILMTAINVATAAVVAHNTRAAHQR